MLINELLVNVVFKTLIKKALNQTQMALKYYQTKIFYQSVCKPIVQTFAVQFPCTCISLLHINGGDPIQHVNRCDC